jgi:hypothetical protein
MIDREVVAPALQELIDALDRRVAHVERLGEVHIAREAAALSKETANRIQELTARHPIATRVRPNGPEKW